MPHASGQNYDNPSTVFSPSGDFLVVYAPTVGNNEGGLQAYKTQGTGPIYPYLDQWSNGVDQAAWDHSNHIYALCKSSNSLVVATLTPTSFYWGGGSTVTIGSPYKMVVVSN